MAKFDPITKIKPVVRALSAYTLDPIETPIKINQNENPYDLPEPIKREVEERVRSRAWSRYPAFVPSTLLERLAAFSGWRADGILAGNGSNELIQALLMVTVGPGTRVLLVEPTFTLYRLQASALGGDVRSVALDAQLSFDTEAVENAAISGAADVVVLCSPNNPTGCVYGLEALERLLERFDGLVVVDEAYRDFSGQDAATLLPRYRNLVLLRTFSKAMAMGGMRVGYMLADPAVAVEVAKAKLPYNLNIVSMAAAEVAIERHDDLLRPIVESIVLERERLIAEIGTIDGLEPYPSSANFFLVRCSKIPPAELFARLVADGILVRDVSRYPMLADFLRITVGTPEENDSLLRSLRSALSDRSRERWRSQ